MKVSAAEQARPLTLQQDSLERLSKLCVEDAVDNGIESGVWVTEPRQHFERRVSDASFTEGGHDVDAEEGHPAD